VLLARLGPAYAEALNGQRRVLRSAWSSHSGTELGTEGDSFFVVFPTAGQGAHAARRRGQTSFFRAPARGLPQQRQVGA